LGSGVRSSPGAPISSAEMINHYKTLGLSNAASSSEIRRAYRVLARRYHPDVNPSVDSAEIFKTIATAYSVLSDPEKKQQYDLELKQSQESFEESFDRARETLKRNQRAKAYRGPTESRSDSNQEPKASPGNNGDSPDRRKGEKFTRGVASSILTRANLDEIQKVPLAALRNIKASIKHLCRRLPKRLVSRKTNSGIQVSLIELSLSIDEAIQGARKTVNLALVNDKPRKVSVNIPPGVRTGSLVRLRGRDSGSEIVLVINVENHSWLSLADRGLTMEIPLTFAEAIEGTKVVVPSFGDPLLVTVEPLTQSGKEVRLKNQGIFNRDGTRGDLFIRFFIKIPDLELPQEMRAVSELIGSAYSPDVRSHLPKRILE
jgi:DnaJ-class molecular chaperone